MALCLWLRQSLSSLSLTGILPESETMISDPSQRLSVAGNEPPDPAAWFAGMIDHCYDYAEAAKGAGRPIVGIMCEFTPREIILAAGAVPVCLCGGSAATIPAAEQLLPANLCPLIKSTFGYQDRKSTRL